VLGKENGKEAGIKCKAMEVESEARGQVLLMCRGAEAGQNMGYTSITPHAIIQCWTAKVNKKYYCVLHMTWQTRNLHIILRAEIQNAISHPFLNGLL